MKRDFKQENAADGVTQGQTGDYRAPGKVYRQESLPRHDSRAIPVLFRLKNLYPTEALAVASTLTASIMNNSGTSPSDGKALPTGAASTQAAIKDQRHRPKQRAWSTNILLIAALFVVAIVLSKHNHSKKVATSTVKSTVASSPANAVTPVTGSTTGSTPNELAVSSPSVVVPLEAPKLPSSLKLSSDGISTDQKLVQDQATNDELLDEKLTRDKPGDDKASGAGTSKENSLLLVEDSAALNPSDASGRLPEGNSMSISPRADEISSNAGGSSQEITNPFSKESANQSDTVPNSLASPTVAAKPNSANGVVTTDSPEMDTAAMFRMLNQFKRGQTNVASQEQALNRNRVGTNQNATAYGPGMFVAGPNQLPVSNQAANQLQNQPIQSSPVQAPSQAVIPGYVQPAPTGFGPQQVYPPQGYLPPNSPQSGTLNTDEAAKYPTSSRQPYQPISPLLEQDPSYPSGGYQPIGNTFQPPLSGN